MPSQVVSEYLAHNSNQDVPPFDGVLFPSTVRDQGNNLALFPPRGVMEKWATTLEVLDIEHAEFNTWIELSSAFAS